MICKICGNEVTEEMLSKSLGELNSRFAYQRSLCDNCYINSIEIFRDNAKVLAHVAHETIQLRGDVNEALEMNRSQSKEHFKSLLGVLSEIRDLHEEVEDVKKEIANLTELLSLTESRHSSPYIRKLKSLPKSTLDLQPGNKIKIGQFLWLILEVNSVGEVRLFCEEIADILHNFGKYDRLDGYSCLDRIFSEKEIDKYEINDLMLPSKNDIEKAITLKMAQTAPFWVLGNLLFRDNKLVLISNSYNHNGFRHGFRPVLTVDSELLTSRK